MGGFYERLVATVKLALKISPVSDDISEVLTPAHFLVLRRLSAEPTHGVASDVSSQLTLQLRFKAMRSTLNSFWNVWRTEYLSSLRDDYRSARYAG